ncbi:hypothetical protein DRN70_01385 [Methanosarcinales archaeon]|nr:MAG: hypothetical protein DRN70_01385 [Methanosarcinales archaeon]
MGILNRIGKAIDALLQQENENYEKGVDFERYVVELFRKQEKYFAIHSWTGDLSDKYQGVRVESDSEPDLTIRYKPTDEKFAVECKYRSYLYNDKLCWTTWEKLKDYRSFAQKNIIPTFIVIGLGGNPRNPEQMFCIPLEKAKYPKLYPSVFRKFERDPRKSFFWKNGVLH